MPAPLIGAHYTQRLSYTAGGLLEYIGWTEVGNLAINASPVWRISRLQYDGSDRLITVSWADGDRLFDNIWDDRAGLAYS